MQNYTTCYTSILYMMLQFEVYFEIFLLIYYCVGQLEHFVSRARVLNWLSVTPAHLFVFLVIVNQLFSNELDISDKLLLCFCPAFGHR